VTAAGFDPCGFYEVAVELWDTHAGDERFRRAAMGRAYYACFHLARLGLERGGRWTAGATNAHERVIAELGRRGRHPLRNRLWQLRQFRQHAEYDLATPFTEAECAQALGVAATLVRLLNTF
jgi:hypothetical protein